MQAIPTPRPFALDPSRVAATSGAIAVNGLVLLLLLAPMAPVIKQIRDDGPVVTYIPVRHEPPPPPPPVRVEVRRTAAPTPRTPSQTTRVAPTQPPVDQPAQAQDYQMPPATQAIGPVIAPPGTDTDAPLAGAHLEYAVAPAPAYPRQSLLDNETGTVMLEVLVDVDGRPIEVKVARSSGHRQLDLAARRQVLAKWRFKPAMRNGQAVQAIGLVPVDFRLD